MPAIPLQDAPLTRIIEGAGRVGPCFMKKGEAKLTMNIWHDISPERISTEEFAAVIEISKGSKKKYELDKETGMLSLDRILYTSTVYPANYGFIPRPYDDDGDPLDVLVLCSGVIDPLVLVNCRPIGVLNMVDSGDKDEKIIAVLPDDPFFNGYHDIAELPKHIFDEMMHFFTVYKALQPGKTTEVTGVQGADEAKKIIAYCMDKYDKEILPTL